MAMPMPTNLLPPPTVINDDHREYGVIAGIIVLGVVSTSFTLLRLWYRWTSRNFGADDYAIIPALVAYIGWIVLALYVNFNAGVGKPLWEITVGEFSVWFKGIVASAFLYPTMSASIRISILLFYSRIFARTMVSIRYAVWIMLGLQAIYVIVFTILPVFIARPVSNFHLVWNPFTRPLAMDDWFYYNLQVALYSVSMAFDAVLLFLPFWPVLHLQMTWKKRIGVCAMFMLGAAASVTAAYKLAIFVEQMARYTKINPTWLNYQLSRLIPPQFDEYGLTFWIPSTIEPSVALIGSALPALRPLIKDTAARMTTAWSSGSNSTAHSDGKSGNVSYKAGRQGARTPEKALLKREDGQGYMELNEVEVGVGR